jgi:hypothetical protein
LIVVDQAAYHGLLGLDYGRGPDIPIFKDRAETILSGGLLYRDVHTETPPIINYVLTIPVLMGGSLLAYQWFFALCNIGVALLLFEVWRRRDEDQASLVAVLFLLNPFTLHHATLNPQDEPLVLLFFLAPLALFVAERYGRSAVAMGVGIWTKMWPVLMLPLFLLARRSLVDRSKMIGITAIISLIIVTPFLLLASGDFLWFLRFYLLGVEEEGSGGVSLWHFLDQVGAKPPAAVMLGFVGIAIMGGYWFSHRKGWDPWKTTTFVVCLFFLVYPKIHSGYYLLPLALLLPYIHGRWRLYGLTLLMFATVEATFKFADGTIAPVGALIAIPIALALVTDALLLLLIKNALLDGDLGPLPDDRAHRRPQPVGI